MASMDLPEPGGPDMSTWCPPPAAAISRARFTGSCPFTSAKSRQRRAVSPGCHRGAGSMGISPDRWAHSWRTSSTG